MSPAKEKLHRMVETLPEGQAVELADLVLEWMTKHDPFLRAVTEAPEVDEPLSPEESAAVTAGRRAARQGKTRPWEEVAAELARK
jgi:hypothetical protein